MKQLPKISIITPTLNSESDIKSCILSVANQTYLNKEHLIIDGSSTDATLKIVKKYAEKYPHIKWISEKDKGIYDAMNKGIDLASGDWLYFLGSDDIFYNNHVLREVFGQKDILSYDIICGNIKFKQSKMVYASKFSAFSILEVCICHQAVFYQASVFKKLGRYDLNYRSKADYVFNIRCLNDRSLKKKYIKKIIAIYNEKGFSSVNSDEEYKKIEKQINREAFSPLIVFLHEKKILALPLIMKKGMGVLKRYGICAFLASSYKFLRYGRNYFKEGWDAKFGPK